MKKIALAAAALSMMTVLTGCVNPFKERPLTEEQKLKYASHNVSLITLSEAAAKPDSPFSMEDVHALRDYLITKPADTDFSSKPYDLDENGIWNAGDFSLMKQAILAGMLEADVPVVYMTKDISPQGLINAYLALGWEPGEKPAVKLSTGEPPASNYLRPELITDLIRYVDGTVVECNTAYGGKRGETAMHYQVAADHGFTDITDFQILDEDGTMTLPVNGGTNLKEDYVGAAFDDYDSYLILSHFKGHPMAGFGGAIKNISIGLAAREGKFWIHSAGKTKSKWDSSNQDGFLESMGEAGKAVDDYLGDRITYVSVMNRLSVDCDCVGRPEEPDMHDIGVLSSSDPVALDQACIDLVYAAEDGEKLIRRIESKNGLHTLEHAEEIGLGSRKYQLVMIDD